jgi:D-alanyl-D-alanine carboxypeptidase
VTAPAQPDPVPAPPPRRAAAAQTAPATFSCPGQPGKSAKPGADGRLLGHLPYKDAPAAQLVAPPEGFARGTCTRLHTDAAAALEEMLAAAHAEAPEVGASLVGLSCFRSIRRQKDVFCSKPQLSFEDRARSSAPPGFSEHHTGLAVDFGDATRPDCNLEECFADTPAGQWLADNAARFGFVLSFPPGNAQGVAYEPWHWRYEGSQRAAGLFADANSRF